VPLVPLLTSADLFSRLLRVYYSTLPGALTVTLGLAVLVTAGGRRLTLSLPAAWTLVLALVGLAGGVALQPGGGALGIAAESMTPLVLLWLVLAANALAGVSGGWRRLVLLLAGVEFGLTRGWHLLAALAGSSFAADNLALKAATAVVYARDELDGACVTLAAVAVVLGLLVVALVAAWRQIRSARPSPWPA
jgi:hypothetical protein